MPKGTKPKSRLTEAEEAELKELYLREEEIVDGYDDNVSELKDVQGRIDELVRKATGREAV